MHRAFLAVLLVGCGGDDDLDTAALFAALDSREGPPPGVTEARYTLDCATLEPPHTGDMGAKGAYHSLDVFPAAGVIPGYMLRRDAPPFAAWLYRRLSSEARNWIESHNPGDHPPPLNLWTAEIPVDVQGRPIAECLWLASRPDPDSDEPYGWITDEVELIIWE